MIQSAPAHAYTFKTLYDFKDKADGAEPIGGVIEDHNGTIYGETYRGGAAPCSSKNIPHQECGTVFSFTVAGGLKVLATFTGPNGAHGQTRPVLIGTTLYGATQNGGTNDAGVLFSVNTDGTGFTLIHQFTGTDGSDPVALVPGLGGLLYGITKSGGPGNNGVLFSLAPSGIYTVLHVFSLPAGGEPNTLVIGPQGSLVGSTLMGGDASSPCQSICGTVFSFVPDKGRFTTLFTIPSSGVDGDYPYVGSLGPGPTIYGAESVSLFSLTPKLGFAPLAGLNYYTVGTGVTSGPLYTPGGVLYGVLGGGVTSYYGVIYSEKNGVITDLYEFNGGADGGSPIAQPILASNGSLIGTTTYDPCAYCGTIWEYTP